MTLDQATELVEDLLQASHDYDVFGPRKSYREHLVEMKATVIKALTDTSQNTQKAQP